jgi:hypothetical protein
LDIGPEKKLTPDLFIPIGDQPDGSTFKEAPLCYNCNGKLLPMPVAEKRKLAREEAAALREQKAEQATYETPMEGGPSGQFVTPIFECAPDESNMEMTTLPDGRILVKTSRRLFVLNLKEALGV